MEFQGAKGKGGKSTQSNITLKNSPKLKGPTAKKKVFGGPQHGWTINVRRERSVLKGGH